VSLRACRRPIPREASSCEGCQYAAWSPDGQYLAVSSDSHAAVAVWRIRLKNESALEPEALGKALFAQLLHCNAAQKAAIKDMLPEEAWNEFERELATSQQQACNSKAGEASTSKKHGPVRRGASRKRKAGSSSAAGAADTEDRGVPGGGDSTQVHPLLVYRSDTLSAAG
jgi:hypothetical protein